jgi:hypothetical protein
LKKQGAFMKSVYEDKENNTGQHMERGYLSTR